MFHKMREIADDAVDGTLTDTNVKGISSWGEKNKKTKAREKGHLSIESTGQS